jgi:transglutaminase-like putative cysteine protease
MSERRRCAGALLLLVAAAGAARAEPINREAPAIYRDELAKLLTPMAQVLDKKWPAPVATDGEAAVTLLFEMVRRVDEKGRSAYVIHQIDRALVDGGAGATASTYWYRKSTQRASLVVARSVQPDGSEQPVGPEAALVQSPQPQAQESLYSDDAQLVVLFPHVKEQTVTEAIVVVEETEARIPGEFSTEMSFEIPQHAARMRYVVDVVEPLATRMTIAPIGQGTPEPKKERLAGGWTRWTWERSRVRKPPPEPGRAPADQVGPSVWLTTLADWNGVARWYARLLRGRDALAPLLAAQVDEWTRGAKGPSEILAALHARVAREVRYVGLEFGIGGYQAHPPDEVWANRYGDCKDKANLLRAMLRRKGITAYLALVNTNHVGRVEKRAPSQLQFDHVIVAVPQPGGGFLFADPTISYGRPGILSPGDADRDVLLLEDDKAEFAHTPPQNAGSLSFELELTMEPGSGLSGWLTVEATDMFAAVYADELFKASRDQQRKYAHAMIGGFFRGAELIDLEVPRADRWDGHLKERIYFVVAGVAHESGGRGGLRFPFNTSLQPDLGDRRERETPYCQLQGTRAIHARFKLPPGWEASELPRPFGLDSPPVRIDARWETRPGQLDATLIYKTPVSNVSVEQYALLFNALHSLDAWVDKPITVGPGAGAPAASTAPPADLSGFVLMPTGQGQVELAERRYPLESAPAQRREALMKVLQWFPSDKATAFHVEMRLAELDLSEHPNDDKTLRRVRTILERGRGTVDKEPYAWGEYLFALWSSSAGRKDEAAAMLARLARDRSLSDFRRSWAAVYGALILREKTPAEAERLLLDTLDLEEEESLPARYRLLADALVRQGKSADLERRLGAFVEKDGHHAPAVMAAQVQEVHELLDGERREQATALIHVLERVIGSRVALAGVRGELGALRERLGAVEVLRQIADGLKKHVAAHPPAWWASTPIDAGLDGRAPLEARIKELASSVTPERFLRHAIELLTRFPPDPDGFPALLWNVAATVELRAADETLFQAVIALCDRLPPGEYRYEARITRARHHERAGEHSAALAMYEAIAADPKAPKHIRLGAWRLGGEVREAQKEWTKALAMYAKLEADRDVNPRSYNGLLRAVFIELELGHPDEALRIARLLRVPGDDRAQLIESRDQMKEVIALVEDGRALAFWKRQERWWSSWLRLEQKLGLGPVEGGVVVPIIADMVAAGREMGASLQAGDRNAVLQGARRLAHAARWSPHLAVELASIVYLLLPLFTDVGGELRELVVTLLADFDAPEPQLVKVARVQVAAHQFDLGRAAITLEMAEVYFKRFAADDALGEAMAYLFAIAALKEKRQLDGARAQLTAALAGPLLEKDRGRTVELLAQVLQAQGRVGDARALLEKELERPNVKADEKAARSLRERLDGMVDERATTERFDAAVKRWRRAHQPPWFDYAEPHTLDADKYKDLDETLRNPKRDSLIPENAKLALLVAEDERQPRTRRADALGRALEHLANAALRVPEVDELFRSLVEEKAFDERLRVYWLYRYIVNAVEGGRDFGALAKHPLAARFSDQQRGYLRRYQAWAALDQGSTAALAAYGKTLVEGPLDSLSAWQLRHLLARQIELGDLEGAHALYAGTETLTDGDDARVKKDELRLELLKTLNHARRVAPTRAELRRMILEAAPAPSKPPAALAEMHYPRFTDLLDRDTALDVRLRQLQARDLADDPWSWTALAQQVERRSRRKGLALRVLAELLRAADDDTERAEVVSSAAVAAIDIDEPAERAALLTALAPYRSPEKDRETLAAIRSLEMRFALRTGDGAAFEKVAAALEASGGKWDRSAAEGRVQRALAIGDAAAAKHELQKLPSETLLDPKRLALMLPALELSGMKDEAQLLHDSGRTALYQAVLRSWFEPSYANVQRVLSLAQALGTPQAVPQEWCAHLERTLRNPVTRNVVAFFEAARQNDWRRAFTAAEALIAEEPNVYPHYLRKGEALVRLGRRKEAVAPLETYLRYSKNERDQRRAEQLLAEARGK